MVVRGVVERWRRAAVMHARAAGGPICRITSWARQAKRVSRGSSFLYKEAQAGEVEGERDAGAGEGTRRNAAPTVAPVSRGGGASALCSPVNRKQASPRGQPVRSSMEAHMMVHAQPQAGGSLGATTDTVGAKRSW